MTLFSCKDLSSSLQEIKSKHNGDYYCVNCLHSFRTEKKLKTHKNVCKNHEYCYREMPEEGKHILKYNHIEKSMKVSFITYVFIWKNRYMP